MKQLHTWTSLGYVVPEPRTESKQGFPLLYSLDEVALLMDIAALVEAGLVPRQAAAWARYLRDHRVTTVRVTPRVSITLE